MGCPMAMAIYGISTRPVLEKMSDAAEACEDSRADVGRGDQSGAVRLVGEENDNYDREIEDEGGDEEEETNERACARERRRLAEAVKEKRQRSRPIPSAFADDMRLTVKVSQCLKAYEVKWY